MEKQFIKLSNGETIAYLKHGKGKNVLVAIHGNMASSVFMKPFFELEDYTVICPDLRGFGDSSYNTPIESLSDLATDVYLLCKELKVDSAHVLGWSLGGGVAMSLVGLYPDFAKTLTLMSSASCMGYQLFGQSKEGAFYAYKTKEDMKFSSAVFGNLQALECGNKAYFDAAFRSVIYTVKLPDPQEYELQLQETLKQRNLLDADWALANLNITNTKSYYTEGNGLIDNITCPVMITAGDSDYIVFPFMTDQNIQYFGNKAIYKKYTKSGHAPMIDKKEEFMADLKAFLAQSNKQKSTKTDATKPKTTKSAKTSTKSTKTVAKKTTKSTKKTTTKD